MEPEIDARLSALEARLTRIEDTLFLSPLPSKTATPTAKPKTEGTPSGNPWRPQAGVNPGEAIRRPDMMDRVEKPGNWLGVIAVLCFVLAAGFIVKLSIETGWLTHGRQIGISAMLGISLIFAGFSLLETDREYAGLLPAAGVIVLYLTAFAAHRFYNLIPFEVALLFTSLISGLCIWLYRQIKHDLYALTATVGAYVAPVVLGLHAGGTFSLYYFLLCSAAFACISIWVESRALTLVSAYLAILVSALVGTTLNENLLMAEILAAHFLIFSVGTYTHSLRTNIPLTEIESWSFLPVLLIFYAAEYYFIDRLHPGLAPWVSLGFAGALIGLYLLAKNQFAEGLGSRSLVFAFVTIVCFHSVYLELLPEMVRPWLFVLIALGIAYGTQFSEMKSESVYRIPLLAVAAIMVIEYMHMLYRLVGHEEYGVLPVAFLSFGSLWVLIATMRDDTKENTGHLLLGSAHLLGIVALYRLTESAGSLAVSASWLIYAVSVLAFAFHRRDETMAKSALLILGLAAGKALLYDAASAPTIIRIFCLLMTGVVLYGCGLMMRRFSDWQQENR